MSKIKVIQKKSTISETAHTRRILQGLGLRGIRSEKVHGDNNCIRGMINKVIHLVDYQLINEASDKAK